MTLINLTTLEAALGGAGETPISATIIATPWAGSKPASRSKDAKLILPAAITLEFIAGQPVKPLELLPTNLDWCYKLVVEAKDPYRQITRYVSLENVPNIDWEDLQEVNPKTLIPPELSNLATQALLQIQKTLTLALEKTNAILLAAQAADTSAVASATSAEASTQSAGNAAQSASAALTSRNQASTSAGAASDSAANSALSATASDQRAAAAAGSATTAGQKVVDATAQVALAAGQVTLARAAVTDAEEVLVDAEEVLAEVVDLSEQFVTVDRVTVALDTDGVPYWSNMTPLGAAIPVLIDTDGVPYITV